MDDEPQGEYTVTNGARNVLQDATVLAIQMQQTYVTSEHILYCLLCVKSTRDIAIRSLKKLKIDITKFKRRVMDNLKQIQTGNDTPTLSRYRRHDQVYYSPKVKEIISLSGAEALSMGTNQIGTEHLLMGIVLSDTGIVNSVFREENLDIVELRYMIYELSGLKTDKPAAKKPRARPPRQTKKTDTTQSQFEKYATDLTRVAKSNELLPVIGRSQEIERVIQTLLRKSKNNPVIIGEPGVGKTAVVEGLAQSIVSGEVPQELQDKRIMTLDMPLMVAGTKYRGQFEERLTAVIDEVTKRDDIILFIDELHMMVGAGDADGAMDASNILKPSLSRGELTIIGATTHAEYTKFIEKDGALERRFQQIQIDEPTVEDTIQILYGVKQVFQDYHNVDICNTCVDKIVRLCERYITDRNFPDKAIDVLDEACAYIKLRNYQQHNHKSDNAKQAAQQKEKHVHDGDFAKAVEWRGIELEARKKDARVKKAYEKSLNQTFSMHVSDVEQVVSKITGVPVNSIKHGDKGKVTRLENTLNGAVIGQQHAVDTIVTSIKRSYAGLSGTTRPIGCFLFLGPTGVGKTHLTKCLADSLFDGVDRLVRVDMSELMEAHSVSKLIGSPPGYVGYDDSTGQLTEQVRRNPYSVVLFDEIEKAHPDVMNLLLQVLDEGELTDSHGRHINFKNTVIILTSNIGARKIQKNTTVGFSSSDTESSDLVIEEARQLLSPEFINRLDEIVMFNELEQPDLLSICDILLQELQQRLADNNIQFSYTPRVKRHIVDLNTEDKYGARPLKRLIARHIENRIADYLLVHEATRLHATCRQGRVVIESRSASD